MVTEFIKVYRVEHGDEMVIPLEVHLKYPHLFQAIVESAVEVVEAVEEVKEAVEAVKTAPTKIKKGK